MICIAHKFNYYEFEGLKITYCSRGEVCGNLKFQYPSLAVHCSASK